MWLRSQQEIQHLRANNFLLKTVILFSGRLTLDEPKLQSASSNPAIGRAVDSGEMKRAKLDGKEQEKYRLAKGDLLFNRTNSIEHVGRTGIFSLDGEYAFASYLIRLSIRRDIADPEYINAYMNTEAFQTGVKSLASRAVGQSNISASSLAGYKIPLPPLDEQRRIVAELNAEAAQMDSCGH
jgi:restriction endonuclease S subunit